MESLAEALQKILKELGIEKSVKQVQLIDKWGEIVGPQIAKVSEAKKLENGILIVKCTHSAWRNELYFQKEQLIQKLNEAAGENLVQDIRFY